MRPLRKTAAGKLARRIKVKWHRACRTAYWSAFGQRSIAPTVLVILGCQRSGTSVFTRCFEYDWRATVFQEESRLTRGGEQRLRLKPLEDVTRIIEACRTPLVVMKPIVESHRAKQLLDHWPNAKVIWIYRNFREVADSNVRRFTSQHANLQLAINNDKDWRGEAVSTEVRAVLERFVSQDLTAHEAACLFWYVRNSLYFECGLDTDPRVHICQYNAFVSNPWPTMQVIYTFIEMAPPENETTRSVDTRSLQSRCEIPVRAEIVDLCQELQARLDNAFNGQLRDKKLAELQPLVFADCESR